MTFSNGLMCLTANTFKSKYDKRIMFAVLERFIYFLLDSCNVLATMAMAKIREGTI